jgi:hypothetical protein
MQQKTHSRRTFLTSSGCLLGGSWLSANTSLLLTVAQVACSRRQAGAAWENLAAVEAEGLAAIAEQIIPGGPDGPGAGDAGVIHFIDVAVGDFMASALPSLREGLEALDERAGGRFTRLDFNRQTELLRGIESTPFFQTVLFLTRAGMFAMPAYGGNRDYAGWRLLGFDHRHAWQPPFGYYDEHYEAGGEDHVES